MTQPRIWVDMITGAGWCCRNYSLGAFARWRQGGHAKSVEIVGIQLTGDLAEPGAQLPPWYEVWATDTQPSDAPGAWTCRACGFRGFWRGGPHCGPSGRLQDYQS